MYMPEIEITQEMVDAYRDAWDKTLVRLPGDRTRAGLKAALAEHVAKINAMLRAELDSDTLPEVCNCTRAPEPHDPAWHGGMERALW